MKNSATIWPIEKLGNIVAGPGAFVDGPFGSNLKASEYVNEGIPLIRIQNVRPNFFNLSARQFIPEWKAGELSRHNCRPGDVVIAKMGDPVGDTCIVPQSAGEGIVVADVVRFRGAKHIIDHQYLTFFLNSDLGRAEFVKRAHGATRQRVNLSDMKEIDVPLPPLDEQRRIAAILDKADAIRRKRRQALTETEAFLHATFLHLVSFQNPDQKNWPVYRIQDLAVKKKVAIRTGPFGSDLRHSEFVDDGISVLGIDNAVQNRFRWAERRFITEEKYERLRRYKVFPGDIIITIMGTTGRSAVIPDDIPEAITTKHLATFTLDPAVAVPEFISYAIHSDPLLIRQVEKANKGAIMAGLNLGIIKELEIHLPPVPLQKHFAEIFKKLCRIQDEWALPETNGDHLFYSLSQRAFRGDL